MITNLYSEYRVVKGGMFLISMKVLSVLLILIQELFVKSLKQWDLELLKGFKFHEKKK